MLIVGELGTGNTRAASSIQSYGPAHGATDPVAICDDEVRVLVELRERLSHPNEVVVVEDIDTLSPNVANRIPSMVRDSPSRVVCTSSTDPARSKVVANVCQRCQRCQRMSVAGLLAGTSRA